MLDCICKEFIMPCPKRKTSKQRRNKKNASRGLEPHQVSACQTCQAPIASHVVCKDSGYQSYPITFHDSDQVIEMDEDPVRAVRKKNNSSLVLAVLSVKRGECSGVVSAGNSGAFLAAT